MWPAGELSCAAKDSSAQDRGGPLEAHALCLSAITAVGATALAVALTPASGATVRPGAIKFGVPRVVDPIHVYGEPDIKVAPNGTVYVSGPQGTGVQRSIWNVSYDNGDSYRLVQDNKTGTAYPSALIPTKSTLGPGGGDTELAVDRHSNVYYADLYALACYTTGYSHDNGKTVQSTPLGCAQPGADRQWLGIYDPAPSDHSVSPYKGERPLIYMKYSDEGVDGGSRVDYSTGTAPTNWHQGDPAGKIATGGGYGPTDAPIVIDQHTGDLLTAVMHGSGMSLAVGEPAADGSAHLNFRYEPIVNALTGDPNTLFPGFAEDKARNLYVVWVNGKDYQVYYSWAKPDEERPRLGRLERADQDQPAAVRRPADAVGRRRRQRDHRRCLVRHRQDACAAGLRRPVGQGQPAVVDVVRPDRPRDEQEAAHRAVGREPAPDALQRHLHAGHRLHHRDR